MKDNTEELKQVLKDKCAEEGIIYAMVAINRETKEIILPRSIEQVTKNPIYYVCCCEKTGDKFRIREIKE